MTTDPRILRATARRAEPAGEVVLKAERPLRMSMIRHNHHGATL